MSRSNQDRKRLKLLYIAGAGRSGSTVLDIVLGNHPDIESVGELTNLVESGWKHGYYCACGERPPVCPFWGKVREIWEERTGGGVDQYIALQRIFERNRYWLRLLREGRKHSEEFKMYVDWTRILFEAIQEVSGKDIIVDSSKLPPRALALSLIPQIDFYLIHLVRDGRGVVWSLKKAYHKNERAGIQRDIKPRPVWKATAFWTITNLQVEWLSQRLEKERTLRIRYEDYVSEPGRILSKVGGLIGSDFTGLIELVEKGQPLEVGHNIAGNRLRMAGKVKLKSDVEWQEKLPLFDRAFVWFFAGWLLARYGYNSK